MYLSGMQIVNFRNYMQTCFEFEKGANTIIGENDSGKTNALTALRLLLDDSFYYNAKRLRESDFPYALADDTWRGHWIIISATFSDINATDKLNDICANMLVDDTEISAAVSSLLANCEDDQGVVTLYVRPQRSIRKRLHEASGDSEKFTEIRNTIRLSDYEFYYTTKSKADFCDLEVYKTLVGDLTAYIAPDPEDDDIGIVGTKINIQDVQNHISLVYVDALRDVLKEIHTPKNPIRRIIEAIEGKIDEKNLLAVKDKIRDLNAEISSISEISEIGDHLNQQLIDILGVVYSPELMLTSELSDEINSLSKFISMKPTQEDDINLLGLGHLNMIFLALKIVEFEVCRSRELLNIMIVEEPEAHIHSHIQKTLFENLRITKNYTQVIMTTHSVHLAESSEISQMNVLKVFGKQSHAMHPIKGLNAFGKNKLKRKSLKLDECIERYLDAKRNVLLFSKGVVLVEGDAEEILIPNLVKSALGVSLDEIGVGLVNIGSTAFEYIASVFSDERIKRYCAIITELDKQSVDSTNPFYSVYAEGKGLERKSKLDSLYLDNNWVMPFFAEYTFEIEFVNCGSNYTYIQDTIETIYVQKSSIEEHQEKIKNSATRNADMLFLSDKEGKGWLATLISCVLDSGVEIPLYILDAIAFAAQETMSLKIYEKMIVFSLGEYLNADDEDANIKSLIKRMCENRDDKCLIKLINEFLAEYDDDIVAKFILHNEKYVGLLVNEAE